MLIYTKALKPLNVSRKHSRTDIIYTNISVTQGHSNKTILYIYMLQFTKVCIDFDF